MKNAHLLRYAANRTGQRISNTPRDSVFACLASEHFVKAFGFYREGILLFIIAPPLRECATGDQPWDSDCSI